MAATARRRPGLPEGGAPAAALLSKDQPASRPPVPLQVARHNATPLAPQEPVAPVDQAELAEHQAKQRAYREWMAKMADQTPAQMHEPATLATPASVEPPPETLEQRSARLAVEAKAEYERRVAEMPSDEPRYVAGYRAPRPKVAGHTLAIGDVVPGAHSFPRLESWLSTGVLVKKG